MQMHIAKGRDVHLRQGLKVMDITPTRHADPSPLPVEVLDESGHATALGNAQSVLGSEPIAPSDAVIHGVRVRLYTNNAHWQQFWSANWFAPDQWAALTKQAPPKEPRIHIYATTPTIPVPPWAGYSHAHHTAFLMGDAPYGPLRALVLGAVGRLLADEEAVHWIRGFLVRQRNSGGLMMLAPDTNPATAIPTLMEDKDTHLLTWDGVFVRYGLVRMVDGVTLFPTMVIDEKGNQTDGYRLFPWLDDYGYWEPRADARCLTLEGQEIYCFARDLDLGRGPEAYAYPLEQAWYVPTALVAAQPNLVGALVGQWAALENVPPATSDLLARFGDWARQVALPDTTQEIGHDALVEALCRLRANPHARAMVSPARLWPGRAGGPPWQPLQIDRVISSGSNQAMVTNHLLDMTSLPGDAGADIVRTLADVLARTIDLFESF